jgi:glycine dehydrogenase subunit 2
MELIFEKSRPGRKGFSIPEPRVPPAPPLPENLTRSAPPELPDISEHELVRHYTRLSQRNFCVDANFYPLGSCTMKYNPKFADKLASLEEFTGQHPLLPQLLLGGTLTQGSLEIIYNLERALGEITGMEGFTSQPMAGAHGELTGVMLIAAYHRDRGEKRRYVIIPDSGHGTNPASAAIAGFEVRTVPSDADGDMDFEAFKEALDEDVAAVMLTCPNTLGVFNPRIHEIADLTHRAGGLMYYDGANLNAILGKARPGDLGFDVVHLNLHKTFATPHGGGGPGAGPVGVKEHLIPYLPISRVQRQEDGTFFLDYDRPKSIGYISPFYGNFLVLVRAYAYILHLGAEGLSSVADHAVLNANYLMSRLKSLFPPGCAYEQGCMHEFVLSAENLTGKGVHALDIAKGLIDAGVHPPTVYFPLIVKEAMMIEPTETESKETLDGFVDTMERLVRLAEKDPEAFAELPRTAPVSRLDETKAAREMKLTAPADPAPGGAFGGSG